MRFAWHRRRATWLHLSLEVPSELFPLKQILSGESGMRPHFPEYEPRHGTDDTQDRAGSSARSIHGYDRM